MRANEVNPLLFDALAFISSQAYADAVSHGLYEDSTLDRKKNTDDYVRQRLTLLIREEVCEMWDARQDPPHFAEEMADVVIMCMSAAGHMGIDLAAEVKRKMTINHSRPYKHNRT